MPYTREDLERIMDETGGSILLPGHPFGVTVTRKEDLPTQEALDAHYARVEELNKEALARTPELRPELLFPRGTTEATPQEPQAPEFDVQAATKEELRAEADRRRLSVPSGATKEDLQDALDSDAPGRQKR